MTFEENRTRLHKLKYLENNWNGHGAVKFNKEFIDFLINLVSDLTEQPEIFPTARDSIQFEYTKDFENYPQTYIEIEIYKDKFEVFIQNDIKEYEKEFIVNTIVTAEYINNIMENPLLILNVVEDNNDTDS